jgi:hypothetical protein
MYECTNVRMYECTNVRMYESTNLRIEARNELCVAGWGSSIRPFAA